mgnify:CR=1 FL=1
MHKQHLLAQILGLKSGVRLIYKTISFECMVWDCKFGPSGFLSIQSFRLYLRNYIPIIGISIPLQSYGHYVVCSW